MSFQPDVYMMSRYPLTALSGAALGEQGCLCHLIPLRLDPLPACGAPQSGLVKIPYTHSPGSKPCSPVLKTSLGQEEDRVTEKWPMAQTPPVTYGPVH